MSTPNPPAAPGVEPSSAEPPDAGPSNAPLASSECDHALQHLYEYLDSEMTAEDETLMRAHVAHCSPCLAELSIEEIVKQLVRRSCHEQAPPQLRARIHAQLTVWRTVTVIEKG